ncbi:hypothetical protein, partial [Halanaerobium sp.]|uniref:hypothetical protein n=1 Tax=Halanaerobium sp. TaxID=1895664 RepID=UPI000DE76525
YTSSFFNQEYLYIGGTEFIGLDDGHIYDVEFEYGDILKSNDYIHIDRLSYAWHEKTSSMQGKTVAGVKIIDTINKEKLQKIKQLVSN